MSSEIEKREDVNPEEGQRTYGDVEFADPVNKKYPVDTEERIRAAHGYINHEDNAAKYDQAGLQEIKDRIERAAKEKGVEIKED